MNELIKLMRPQQWLKNSFVFVGLFYSREWNDQDLLLHVILITCAFCLVSSAVYIINDCFDKNMDREHPIKKQRPIASGAISTTTAITLTATLLALSFAISSTISWQATIILIAYSLLNLAYSILLKHLLIIDVLVISLGFMLRILAGTIGVGIQPSHWLLICGLWLTLFLGFTKRRSEFEIFTTHYLLTRKVLQKYSQTLLNRLIVITASCAFVSYSLYTFHQYQDHHLPLFYTLPWVIYGMGRYLYLLYSKRYSIIGFDIARDLLMDWQLLFAVGGWFIITAYLLFINV